MAESFARRATPIREEDILGVAMERFWAAEGGNQDGVKAVLKFARAVYLDMADEACAELAAENADNDSRGDSPWDNGSGSRALGKEG